MPPFLTWTPAYNLKEAEKSKESWVKIISNDNFTFIVKRSVAEKSGMLGSMLNSMYPGLCVIKLLYLLL